ncbi:MAG: hypothetical protein Q7R85_02560 [bacterium]|nr:hypothetical protein [bacterium]
MGIVMFVLGAMIFVAVMVSVAQSCVKAWGRVEAEVAKKRSPARLEELKRRMTIPVTFDPVKVAEVVLDVREAPKAGESRRCMFRINVAHRQTCKRCNAAFYGERIRSEKCPRCGSALEAWVCSSNPWASTHVVMSEESLLLLFGQLCDRGAVRL